MRSSCIAFMTTVCLCAPAMGITYSGRLDNFRDGGLSGTGKWIDKRSKLTWTVSTPDDPADPKFGVWTYQYTLKVKRGGISHFDIEVSPTFVAADILSWCGPGELVGPEFLSSANGNPNMPEGFWGIKWDDIPDDILKGNFSVETRKQPVWGDFYSKDGKAGGTINTLWNTGLPMEDPIADIGDGSVNYHLLVPDTQEAPGPNPVPEPLTGGAVLMSMGGLLAYVRRRLRARTNALDA